jgi:hypothetical protein
MRRFHAIALACPRNFAAGNISGPDPGLQTLVPQVLRSEVEVKIDEPTQTSAFQGTTKPTTHYTNAYPATFWVSWHRIWALQFFKPPAAAA